jgi:putative membrane protein
MRSFVFGTVATAIAFAVVTWLVPQYISYEGDIVGLLGLAVVFGVVNGLIKPIVKLLALPLRIMTLGLIGFVINAAMLLLTAWVADLVGVDFQVGDFPPDLFSIDTFVAALLGAIVLGIVNAIAQALAPGRAER